MSIDLVALIDYSRGLPQLGRVTWSGKLIRVPISRLQFPRISEARARQGARLDRTDIVWIRMHILDQYIRGFSRCFCKNVEYWTDRSQDHSDTRSPYPAPCCKWKSSSKSSSTWRATVTVSVTFGLYPVFGRKRVLLIEPQPEFRSVPLPKHKQCPSLNQLYWIKNNLFQTGSANFERALFL